MDNWADTVADKLIQVGDLARAHGCVAVLDGGDFFDDKTPVRTSHRLVSRVARIHATYPCPVWANVGNHDVRLAQMDNLGENPLETLFAAGVFRRLYDEHEVLLEAEGVKVRVVGIPYHGPRYDLDRFRAIQRGDEDWLVCCAHVLASATGGEMFANEDIIKYDDLPDLAPGVDSWFFGHWHKNQGIQEIRGGKWVVNVGSLTRGALTLDNVEREPGVVIAGFWPRAHGVPPAFDFVKLNVRPASEIFDLDKRVREEARAMTVDAFVASVKQELETKSDKPFDQILEKMDIPVKVKERALQFIENARR